jgi:ferredoxin
VPWFVDKVDGEYDFRIMDGEKLRRAVKLKLCWVCGDALGRHKAFVIGPMCGVNRTNGEPPSHVECAQFAARHCPFLSRPHMKRREDDLTRENAGNCAGIGLTRNPGACGVWVVKDYALFPDGKGRFLFNIGIPERVEWYAEGRAATRAEVLASIQSGEPLLREQCEKEATPQRQIEAHEHLTELIAQLLPLLPAL